MAPNNADTAAIADLYTRVMAEVKAAAMVCPAEDVQSYYNPTVYWETENGIRDQNKVNFLHLLRPKSSELIIDVLQKLLLGHYHWWQFKIDKWPANLVIRHIMV
jgi:hypothetical protein